MSDALDHAWIADIPIDEGGAQGLLMNHLGLGVVSDGSLRVVFDASDSVGRDGDEELLEEPLDEVNLTEIRSMCHILSPCVLCQ